MNFKYKAGTFCPGFFIPNNWTFEKLMPESNFATKASFMAANKAAYTC
ncbi:hypothetical protein BvCms36BK_00382 [Escherichia coli]|jgi:hypothetical protein|nr:hypothetical protein BvCms36BK_00382 [Escherichia coli]